MKVIAVTGMALAGKGEIIRHLSAKFSIPFYVMGHAVREETKARGLPAEKEGELATQMRKEFGPYIWAKRTLEKIKADNPEACLIDGVRSLDEVEYFKEKLGEDFCLIAVHANPKTRSIRMKARGRADDLCEPLAHRDKRELSWGLGGPIALADYIFVNEEDLEEFKNRVSELISKLLNNGAVG